MTDFSKQKLRSIFDKVDQNTVAGVSMVMQEDGSIQVHTEGAINCMVFMERILNNHISNFMNQMAKAEIESERPKT